MYDEMVDDIFDQQFKKPRKNLNQLKPYKDDEYLGDDDFDIAYRTPANIDVTDLIPVDYKEAHAGDNDYDILEKYSAGGFYRGSSDEIIIRNKPSLITILTDEYNTPPYDVYSPEEKKEKINNMHTEALIHEHAHKKLQNKEDRIFQSNRKIISEFDKNYIKSLAATEDVINHRKEYKKEEPHPKLKSYLNNNYSEKIAYPAGWGPEKIINPTTKLTKTINRIFFD
jgi:hypothetical protein